MRSVLRPRVDVGSVLEAVAAVAEPLSGRPLGELGLLDTGEHRHGTVHVRAWGLDDEPGYRDALGAALREAAGPSARVEVEVADDDRRQAVSSLLRPLQRRPGGFGSTTRVFAVASGKGGVGKSTVTANLAASLAAGGARVGLLDADVWGYSQPTQFGLRRSPVAVPGLMFPLEAHGVRLMSVGFFVDDDEPVVWRGPMLHKALEQFVDDVAWGELDVLLVDLPPGTGDVTLSLLDLLPGASMIVVTTPQHAAESVAARVSRMARDARMPIAGVVENMAGDVFGTGGGARLAAAAGAPLLGSVPLAGGVRAAGDAGVPLVISDPGCPAAVVLSDVAARLPARTRSLSGLQLPLLVTQPQGSGGPGGSCGSTGGCGR
jgi:ATP-binding protein involved in chromosome partitioning